MELAKRLKKSLFEISARLWHLLDDRTGFSQVILPYATHRVPPGIGWWYVFGSATLFAFVVQVFTGIALATAYVPSTEDAYASLQFITHDAFLGSLLRGMHYFGASAMVLLVGIHMARTFLMGAYKFPREMSWLSGIALLGLTLAMAFTGQLLRWDQNAVWSVVVSAAQAARTPIIGNQLAKFIIAGDTLGGATLSRFFAFHVFFIPALIFGLVAFHLYLILHNGISEPPMRGRSVDPKTYRAWYRELVERHGQPFWPDVAWRDVVFGVLVVVVIALCALVLGPPELSKPPDPSIIEAYPRPDWYFLWYFALVAIIPHWLEDYFLVFAPLTIALALILLPFFGNRGERSPLRRPLAPILVLIVVGVVGTLWMEGERAPWSPKFEAAPLPSQIVSAITGPAREGAKLFHDKGCQSCHAIGGYGGIRGPDLSNVGNRLTSEQIVVSLLNGVPPNMPAYGDNITTDELDALVAFLNSRQSR